MEAQWSALQQSQKRVSIIMSPNIYNHVWTQPLVWIIKENDVPSMESLILNISLNNLGGF